MGAGAATGVAGSAGAAAGAAALSPASSAATDDGAASTAEASSPSSSRTAIGLFTLTPSVPSAISNLPMVPSSTASNSMVALSVSISAIMSPEETVSPSFTSHFASVPSSIVGDRAGIRISVAIFCRLLMRRYLSKARPWRALGLFWQILRMR